MGGTMAMPNESAVGNICAVLGCKPEDVVWGEPLSGGLTNKTWRFSIGDCQYVYREPGVGTDEITNRACETFAQGVAARLGIDKTFIHEDPQVGWKVSHYIDCDEPFSCHNERHLQKAMELLRALHACGEDAGYVKDMHKDTILQMALLDEDHRARYSDFDELFEVAERLDAVVKADGLAPVLCHNDFYDPNFLITGDEMYLIDWEYSGMSDYASDLAVFICCSDYTYDEALHALEAYFQRSLTQEELVHCVAYIQVISFHWLVWALYMDQCGEPVGPLEGVYHEYARSYATRALALIGA